MAKQLRLALASSIVVVLALVIAACGGGGGSDSNATSVSTGKIGGTVTVWDPEYGAFPQYHRAADQIDSEFERLNPGVKVDRIAQPVEGWEAQDRAAFVAREGPDIMVLQPGAAGVLSFSKGLEVLNEKIDASLENDLTQWESATAGFTAEGPHYGVPIGLNGIVFYYNKKLFAKAGLPETFEPKTWSEVLGAAARLKAAGIQPFTGGNKEGYENQFWFSMGFQTQSSPQQAIELAEGEMPYTDEAVAEAFGPEFEAQEAGYYPADRFTTSLYTDGVTRFGEGQGAMITGLWNVAAYWGEFNEALGEKNVGIFFPPGNHPIGTLANNVLSIPTFAKNETAAVALIEFIASRKGMEILAEIGGYMPNRLDVPLPADAPIQAQELLEASRQPGRVMVPYIMLPSAVVYGPMSTEINEALQGRTSLEQAQQAMQETAEKTVE